MLVYSKKHYLPTITNIVVLDFAERGYLYTSLDVYEAGVILSNIPEYIDKDNLEILIKPRDVPFRESISELYNILPYPLKPLAYMLYLTDVEYVDPVEQIGVLDIILRFSQPVHWFDTPRHLRADFTFGPCIQREYQLNWKNFFNSSIDYDSLLHPDIEVQKHPIYVVETTKYEDVLKVPVAQVTTAPEVVETSSKEETESESNWIKFEVEENDDEFISPFDTTDVKEVSKENTQALPAGVLDFLNQIN